MGRWWLNRHESADNSADDGGGGRARGCSGDGDAEDGDHEDTDAEDGADGNYDVVGDDDGGECDCDLGTEAQRAALSAVERRYFSTGSGVVWIVRRDMLLDPGSGVLPSQPRRLLGPSKQLERGIRRRRRYWCGIFPHDAPLRPPLGASSPPSVGSAAKRQRS